MSERGDYCSSDYSGTGEDWNCGLLSAASALSLGGISIGHEALLSRYHSLGFRIYEFGITSAHVALLIRTFGFAVTLRSYSNWLRALWKCKNDTRVSKELSSQQSKDALRAMKMLVTLGGRISFPLRTERPSAGKVVSAIAKGRIVILCVDAESYYGIKEDWNHYLVATARKRSVPFRIIDSLEHTGASHYPEWSEHLRLARRFEWSTWSGDMIEIMRADCRARRHDCPSTTNSAEPRSRQG